MFNAHSNIRFERLLLIVVIAITLIKLISLPFCETTDADGASRAMLALSMHEHPRHLWPDIWLPLPFYINALFMGIWDHVVYTPKLVNIIAVSLTSWPLFLWLKRLSSDRTAFITTIIFLCNPILWMTSLQGLSEPLFLLFLTSGLYLIEKASTERLVGTALLAGIFMTIAAGVRYEAWPIGILMILIPILKNSKQIILPYLLTFSIFPIYWSLGHFLAGNHLLQGVVAENIIPIETLEDYLRRIWFFPLAFIISVGPIAGILILLNVFKKRPNWRNPYLLLLLIYYVILSYKAFSGTLILHHRFSINLTLLSLPLICLIEWPKWNNFKILLLGLSTLGISFIYNQHHVTPIPRIKDDSCRQFMNHLEEFDFKERPILLLGNNWQTHYYLGLRLLSHEKSLQMAGSIDINNNVEEALQNFTSENQQGYIISNQEEVLVEKDSTLTLILKEGDFVLYQLIDL